MKSCIHIYRPFKNKMQTDLIYIMELYFEKIEPVFINAEEEADAYSSELYNIAMSTPSSGENDPDPATIAEACHEAGIEKYEILSLMKYRSLMMWISCMYQVWEQQVISFIRGEVKQQNILHEGTFGDDSHITSIGKALECFAFHNYNIKLMECWDKIEEMRLLVNVIKHAEGYSAEDLRMLRPDFFEWDDSIFFRVEDKLKYNKSTLLTETLNVSKDDFFMYYEFLYAFWDELPEVMCSNDL